MARPIVLVYQELAAVTTTPATPDLNCLIVGPAYWIKDYLDDKGDIQTSANYGTKEADNPYVPPVLNTTAITVAEPPANKTGAILDASSVKIFFDEARVLIGQDVTTGAIVSTTNTPHNRIDYSGATAGFISAMASAIAGDYVIIQDPSSPGVATDLVKRILSVDTTNKYIYTTTNFAVGNVAAILLRVEREVTNVEISSSFITVTGNQTVIGGGVTTVLTGEITARTVLFAKVYIQYRSLRQDLRGVDTVSSETEIETKIGKIDARNPLAGVTLAALGNTTTPIQFFGVQSDDLSGHNDAMELIEGRKDIYAIVPITVTTTILAAWKVSAEGLADPDIADTSGIPQKFRVILGAQDLPTTKVVNGPFTAGRHRAVDGAIANTPIVAADDATIVYDAAATYITAGVQAGDKLVITEDAAATTRLGTYTVAEVLTEMRLRVTEAIPVAAVPFGKQEANVKYYIIRGTGIPESTLPASFIAGSAATPATITTTIDRALGVANEYRGKVVHLINGITLAVIGDYLVGTSTAANPAVFGVTPAVATAADVDGTVVNTVMSVTTARTLGSRRPFRIITDAAATFRTSAVRATDTLQVPNPITGSSYTTTYDYTVAYIPNENDVVLEAFSDVEAQAVGTGDTNLKFRISRTLTKDDQIDELVAISQSFSSRRVILVWPDSVDVAGLVDGSKTRASAGTPEAADAQKGYYMAGVVGGMTAGLPPHQGFTNLGIASVDEIYHATRYFSDRQLTELSDAGWFVFAQDTTNTLPYCIHQLTTDADTLETGEYSVVKNFDYVAMFFQDIVDEFLGEYNIYEETLALLEQSLSTGIDILKLRKYAKIGAPLTSADITSVLQHGTIEDRVEIYMNVGLPKPLNRIGLHLISV